MHSLYFMSITWLLSSASALSYDGPYCGFGYQPKADDCTRAIEKIDVSTQYTTDVTINAGDCEIRAWDFGSFGASGKVHFKGQEWLDRIHDMGIWCGGQVSRISNNILDSNSNSPDSSRVRTDHTNQPGLQMEVLM